MTIRVEIIPDDIGFSVGWVEVGPYDYEYNGADPDGEIEQYLSDVGDGTISYDWPEDYDSEGLEYPPEFEILHIKHRLEKFDEIWYIEFPDDF